MRKSNYLLVSLAIVTSSCSSTRVRYQKPEKFIESARTIMSSADTYTYLGTSQERIYYEYTTIITPLSILGISKSAKTTIFWSDRKDIPPSIVSRLEEEKKAFERRLRKHSQPSQTPSLITPQRGLNLR